jgi:hypothetical protein
MRPAQVIYQFREQRDIGAPPVKQDYAISLALLYVIYINAINTNIQAVISY